MTLKTRSFLILPLMLFVIAAGCSTKSRLGASVHGKVSYKGEPVGGGTISFYPQKEEQGGGYGFSIKEDGTYEGTSMPPGEYVVAIETESANPNRAKQTYGQNRGGDPKNKTTPDDYRQKMMKMGKAPATDLPQGKYVKIPTKYNDRKSSGLTATLTNGKNDVPIDLKD